jgi:hypothetical protein
MLITILLVCGAVTTINAQCCEWQPSIYQTSQEILEAIIAGGGGGGGGGITPEEYAYWQNLQLAATAASQYWNGDQPPYTGQLINRTVSQILADMQTLLYKIAYFGDPTNNKTVPFLLQEMTTIAQTIKSNTAMWNGNTPFWPNQISRTSAQIMAAIESVLQLGLFDKVTNTSTGDILHAIRRGNDETMRWYGDQPQYSGENIDRGIAQILADMQTLLYRIAYFGDPTNNKTVPSLLQEMASQNSGTVAAVKYYPSYIASQIGNTQYALDGPINKTTAQLLVEINENIKNEGSSSIPAATDGFVRCDMWTNTFPPVATPPNTIPSQRCSGQTIDMNGKGLINGPSSIRIGAITKAWGVSMEILTYNPSESFGRFLGCGATGDTYGCNVQTYSSAQEVHNAMTMDGMYNTLGPQNPQSVDYFSPWNSEKWFTITITNGVSPPPLPFSNDGNCDPSSLQLNIEIDTFQNTHPSGINNKMEIILFPWIQVGGTNTDRHSIGPIKIAAGLQGLSPSNPAITGKYYCAGKDTFIGENCVQKICLNPSQMFAPSGLIKRWMLEAGTSNFFPYTTTVIKAAGRNSIRMPIGSSLLGKQIPTVNSIFTPQPGISISQDSFKKKLLGFTLCGAGLMLGSGTLLLPANMDTTLDGLFSRNELPDTSVQYIEWLEVIWDKDVEAWAKKHTWPQITWPIDNWFINTDLDYVSLACTMSPAPNDVRKIPQAIWALIFKAFVPTV